MTGDNLRSGFFLVREIRKHMRDSRTKGCVLLITSLHRDTPRWWHKSPSAVRGLPTTSRRSLSSFRQKDLAVVSWERR
jgi:hypothetical protein